jgi:NhaP-type Na+/H+ or K+/H+ antiporter
MLPLYIWIYDFMPHIWKGLKASTLIPQVCVYQTFRAVMAAVSPAVVIPCLFSLQERGYGKSKGIPTLVIAAATFDDVIAISVFSVALSIIFSTGEN